MADQEHLSYTIESAISDALGQLLTVRHAPMGSYVHLPIFYPSGAGATVLVTRDGTDFRISDAGFAYREVEMVGAERAFPCRARAIAGDLGLDISSRAISARATRRQLAATMADVAAASTRIATEIVSRVSGMVEIELVEHLQDRLAELFGKPNIDFNPTIPGASARPWDVSAIVRLEDRRVVFDAVSNHALSVYSTATKFHDISLLGKPPITVSVVHSVQQMGNLYNLLAQAGHVLQEDAPNTAFKLAIAA